MLKIQVIGKKLYSTNDYEIIQSPLDSPYTFDLFDINIINLQDADLWKNDGVKIDALNCSNDLRSLCTLIENTNKSKIIILFPANYEFQYEKKYSYDSEYYSYEYKLKDGMKYLKTIVSALFSQITDYDFIYENSLTKCGESVYKSAFCFTDVSRDILTRAEGSGKATTIQVTDNCIVTTLLLSDSQCSIKDFIAAIGLDNDKPDYPQWLIEYDRLDDEMQKKLIEGHTAQVEQLQNEINQAEKKLASNLRYKSVLTENGDRLVEVVFEILEKILEYDLSSFKDEKKEDFLIRLKDCTFIGEIKGITSNVKSENVSQVDVHYQTYLEKLEAEGQQENVKALLIINAQRNKPLNERAEVHEKQIELAQRNGSLIIPTEKLLCIYERFLKQEVSSEQIIRAFNTQIGLLNTDLM